MKKVYLGAAVISAVLLFFDFKSLAAGYTEVGEYGRPFIVTMDTPEQIEEEIRLGEMELLAQLVEAEAGNQPFEGKCLVVDCILNRVESPDFPNTITEVIYQKNPIQFSTAYNGALEKAGWNMKESDYAAVEVEMQLHGNKDFLYFNNSRSVSGSGTPVRVGGHWFNG